MGSRKAPVKDGRARAHAHTRTPVSFFRKRRLDMLNPLPSTAIRANRKKMGLKNRDWSNFENGTKTLKGLRT